MITTDETVTDTPRRKERVGPKGRLQRYFCGHHVYTSLWAEHDCENKREAMAPRKCDNAGCDEVYTPKRPGQRFHSDKCRFENLARCKGEHRKQANKRQPARKSLTPEQLQALDMAPMVMALEAAEQQAAQYVPLMGEALYNVTMELMR